MSENIQLSIIVPVYNTEPYLPRCIESILSQIFYSFKLILVDDGSTDGSGKICDEYKEKDHRITVVHKKNGGLIRARFTGLSKVTTPYVTFVDSDDWIEPDLFEKLMHPLLKDASMDISISPHIYGINGVTKSRFTEHAPMTFNKRQGLTYMLADKYFSWTVCGKIYKTSLFDNLAIGNLDNSYGEDLEINYKVFKRANKLCYQPIFGYHYVFNPKSMMSQYASLKRLGMFARMVDIMTELKDKDDESYDAVTATYCIKYAPLLIEAIEKLSISDADKVSKYQTMMNIAYDISKDKLTDIQKRRCKIAAMDLYSLQKARIKNEQAIRRLCREFSLNKKEIYIYGCGKIAAEAANILKSSAMDFDGFVVTEGKSGVYWGKPVKQFQDVYCADKASQGFIVAVNEVYFKEIEAYLKKFGDAEILNIGQYSFSY